jgi:hypothetical protein
LCIPLDSGRNLAEPGKKGPEGHWTRIRASMVEGKEKQKKDDCAGPPGIYSMAVIGTQQLHACQWSTVLPSHPPPACTFARWHSVVGSRAPGLIYAAIFSCDIPRISFAFRSRAPDPYHSASVVDCRRRWRISMEVTIAQSCDSGDGRGNGNMRLPCVPRRPSSVCVRRTGKNWKGWRFLSTWGWGGSSCMMMLTPRPCGRI